jgi:hypothetical protein
MMASQAFIALIKEEIMLHLSLSDFEQQFGVGTERRVELYQVFQEWLNAVQSTSLLRQVWVFGSFATNKPGPGDLDMVALFAAEFDADAVAPPLRHWLDHELCHQLHEIDLFTIRTFACKLTYEWL